MNKTFEDFIKENEAHDVAIIFCGNNKTIGKAVVSYFFLIIHIRITYTEFAIKMIQIIKNCILI